MKYSKNVSIGKGTWGIGVGASCKLQYALTVDNENIDNMHQFTLDGLRKVIVHEAMDELKLLPEQIGEFVLVKYLLVFYLELIEGGKPQLLFYMPVAVDFESLSRHFHDELQKKTEREAIRHSNFNKMKTDGSELDFISIIEKQALKMMASLKAEKEKLEAAVAEEKHAADAKQVAEAF